MTPQNYLQSFLQLQCFLLKDAMCLKWRTKRSTLNTTFYFTSVVMYLKGFIDFLNFASLHAAFPTSQDWFQHHHQCISHTKDVGRKGVLVSRICRDTAALCLDSLNLTVCCCSGRFANPVCGYLMFWEWDSTISYLCGASWKAQTNPTYSIFRFDSLWIRLIWCEVQLALNTNVLQRETFDF